MPVLDIFNFATPLIVVLAALQHIWIGSLVTGDWGLTSCTNQAEALLTPQFWKTLSSSEAPRIGGLGADVPIALQGWISKLGCSWRYNTGRL